MSIRKEQMNIQMQETAVRLEEAKAKTLAENYRKLELQLELARMQRYISSFYFNK